MTEPKDLEALPPALEHELEVALRSAWQPQELSRERHERILELALEDPFAAASPEEIAESERLRQALDGQGHHEHLPLAVALAAAVRPAAPSARPQLAAAPSAAAVRARPRVVYVVFGAATAVLAAAAAVALVLGSVSGESSSVRQTAPTALSTSRSSAPLFDERFTLEGTTARVDRIASVRERELRQNRYAGWGVR